VNVSRLAIPDVLLIEPKVFGDERGTCHARAGAPCEVCICSVLTTRGCS
jgi:hypothetical protein